MLASRSPEMAGRGIIADRSPLDTEDNDLLTAHSTSDDESYELIQDEEHYASGRAQAHSSSEANDHSWCQGS